MKIEEKQKDGVFIFELSGELDFHTSPPVREKLQSAADQETPKILINLQKVSYIDSSGLATFVELLQKTKRNNGRLVLSELAAPVRSVFEIAKLDMVFSLAKTDQEAFEVLNA